MKLWALGLMTSMLSGGAPASAEELGGTLLVLNKSEASVSFLSCATGKEIGRAPTGDGPHEVAISPDGRTAVVGNYGTRVPGSTLTVVAMPSMAVTKTIDLGDYHRPHGIAFLPEGQHVVVTCEAEKAVLEVDVKSGEVVQVSSTEQEISHMLGLHPEGELAFVANIGSGSVSVLDLEAGELIEIVETGAGAEGVDVSPDGKEVWVGNRDANNLTILDPDTLEITETLGCPSFPIRVKFTPDGQRVLVSNARSADVAVFDAATRKELARIPMKVEAVSDRQDRLFGDSFGESPVPVGILIEPDGKRAFIANTNADVVSVIDLEKLAVVDRWRAGKEPDGLGYTAVECGVGEEPAR